ncbi:CNP1-like family protein [Zoogloea sp.]|uniref:CNP1-like family protein n=1 Tax=Zoogloea sp. TaxID=49181 RepID=UPI0035AFC758
MISALFRLPAGVLPVAIAGLLLAAPASAQRTALFEDEPKAPWSEAEVVFPAYPADASLIPLQIGPTATARFFIDEKSLSLAADGVVRFTLVVRTQGGAENVSYEGIRCETAERRLYAVGRKPGEWVASRNVDWRQIEEKTTNRVHAALAKDYFCPPGMMRPGLGQIVESLRRDGGVR